ncbi:MAG: DUF192 domain-containing protein [Syntrophomonadaceae bacterium]|nr:DUF192 domain-containing protein [Syntrophomonadaceae bacterium]
MKKLYCRVSNQSNKMIAANIEVAGSFLPRLRGLLGKKTLSPGEGMLLRPCNSIHCLGMRFPIDVIFMDRHTRVTRIREYMYPCSLASDHKAHCVLELCAGEIKKHGIEVGDQLRLYFTYVPIDSDRRR